MPCTTLHQVSPSVVAAALAVCCAMVAASCSSPETARPAAPATGLSDVSAEDWRRLSSMRILFGHQSVGMDILHGVSDLLKANPAIDLRVIPSTPATAPGLHHFAVGRNEQPFTKIEAFERMLDASADAAPDIALMKFCYIDTTASTDVDQLFQRYRQTLAGLRERHPRTVFVHVTMPLRVVQSGWRVPVKRLLGRPIGGHAENMKRNRFNDLMRAEYRDTEPVFDLAAIESTRPDGERASFVEDGKQFFALAPEHTYDGGHLNESGRRLAAERLLTLLATVGRARPVSTN